MSVIKNWFDRLLSVGPLFGYFPEPSKSSLIVKDTTLPSAEQSFNGSGVSIVQCGKYLGGVIGNRAGVESFVSSRVSNWSNYVSLLSSIAADQPQAAYIALTKSLQSEWIFLQRVTPDCGGLFNDLEHVLCTLFLPSLIGHPCGSHDRFLYSLPIRMGGLNIKDPTKTADQVYSASRNAVSILMESITKQSPFNITDHYLCVTQSRQDQLAIQKERNESDFKEAVSLFDARHQRAILRSRDSLSHWLCALPVLKDNFNLSSQEFRDAICMRYLKPLVSLPPLCDGCGAQFSTVHALDCRKGGLVSLRHNEIRDLLCDLSSIVWSNVVREPIIQEPNANSEGLVADMAARGVWQRQCTAMFDVRVVDSDSPSYANRTPQAVLTTAEKDKKKKYVAACESNHCSFTPLCLTVDGVMGSEMRSFIDRLAECLSIRWDLHYSVTVNWVRTKLSFALLRATNLCIRGTRSKWRGMTIEDGLGVNPSLFSH